MIDWNALLQTIIASGVAAGAMSYVFKKYTEKRIEHVFDRKLKEYEAKLQESTALRIKIDTIRIEGYNKLSALMASARKDAVDLCEMSDPTEYDISKLMSKAAALQDMVHDLYIILHSDQIYGRVHVYKIKLKTLIKEVENERKWRDMGQIEQADGVREIITRSIADIQSENELIGERLGELIQPKRADL